MSMGQLLYAQTQVFRSERTHWEVVADPKLKTTMSLAGKSE